MVYYLDSSALLRILLKSADKIPNFSAWPQTLSSTLLAIESARTLDRLRLEAAITDDELSGLKEQLEIMLQSMTLAAIDERVVTRAQSAFPTVIRSLDAIHLATAILWQEERKEQLKIISHDKQMLTAAKALGFSLYPA